MKTIRLLGAFAVFALISAVVTVPFMAEDMHQLKKISGEVVSPDGKFVVFGVSQWRQTGEKTNYLMYYNIESEETNQLTAEEKGQDFNPVFSSAFPNVVFFLSARTGTVQIHYMKFPPAGDTLPTPNKLSDYPVDIANLKISANTVSFSAEVYFECQDNVLECTAGKNGEIEKRGPNTWGIYTKLFVRHWDVWTTEGKGSHIFVHVLKKDENRMPTLDGQEPTDIMLGMESNSPVPPFGGSEQFDVSSDGSEVAFTCHHRTADESWKTGWKIYIYQVGKGKPAEHLTSHIDARTQNPRFSKDGTKLGFLSMKRPGLESDSLHIQVYSKMNQKFEKISDQFDRSVNDFMWYNDNTLLFSATDSGYNKLYTIQQSDPNKATSILDDKFAYGLPVEIPQTSKMIINRSSYTQPAHLVTFKFDVNAKKVSEIAQISTINEDVQTKYGFQPEESFTFKGGYGDDVQGFIIKPFNFDESKKYPLAYLIHGGPEGAWESSWSYRWNPQLWSQRGYAVVMVNPHGSSGMGIKFQDAVRNDWGGVPYQDLMAGVDHVVQNYEWIDDSRKCACGASYGGYMVNWIQGQTDRFNCLITHDGVFSTLSMFYATEELWFPYSEYCPHDKIGCSPYESEFRKYYTRYSPESYVQNWKTPHLIIHGSNDFRIPISEGLSAFTALQVQKIPSKFIHYTQENHWVLKQENSIKWYDEVLGWMDQWTQQQEKKHLKFIE